MVTSPSRTVKVNPYITLEGRAEEAIRFYEEAIGAEVISLTTYGEMPDMPSTFSDEMKRLVAHALLKVGDAEIMLSDTPSGSPLGDGKRVTICITTTHVEHSRTIYEALRQGGQINIPFQVESFSPGFGDVTDKFGVTFQVYTVTL